MSTMNYKNYSARIEYDAQDHIFTGLLLGIKDTVTFHADTVSELEKAFHESVDDYLAACVHFGKEPAKPASGKVMLRVPPQLHAKLNICAQATGKSLNAWVTEVLSSTVEKYAH